MTSLREIGRRLARLFSAGNAAAELDDEIRFHVQQRQARLIERGVPPDAAHTAARTRFGNLLATREEALATWRWLWIDQLLQDIRFALRTLRRQPLFAAAIVLTLGLAIGATTAIFSLVNGVLLKPLPFDDPDRLVHVTGRNWSEDRGEPDTVTGPVGTLELEAVGGQSQSLSAVAGYAAVTQHLDDSSGVERVRVGVVDLSFFSVLGVDPVVGRAFRADDASTIAVISESLWRRRFASDPQVTRRTLSLDGRVFDIVGVMPDAFEFPYRGGRTTSDPAEARTQAWLPLPPLRTSPEDVRRGRVNVVGRLAHGATVDSANAELAAIAARIEQQHYAGTATRVGMRAAALSDSVLGPVRATLWMLFAAVGLVLAIACANVTNLLLARMLVRAREVVTRAALGAGRLRLARQFLAESLVLALAGGALGIWVAAWSTPLLVHSYAGGLPRVQDVALDGQTFAFLVMLCTAVAVIVGVTPAFTAAGTAPNEVTRSAGGHATLGRRTRYVRDALVVVEVALAFVLAVGATTLVAEMRRLRATPTGMDTENVLVLHMTPQVTTNDYVAIESRVSAMADVRGAGFIQYVPLQHSGWEASFAIEGQPPDPHERLVTDLRYVTPGYFGAVGVPVLAGRGFLPSDTAEAPPVVLVNHAFARRYFSNADAVGRQLDRGLIVGVVGDVRSSTLAEAPGPELYYVATQNLATTSDAGMALVVSTTRAPEHVLPAVRSAVSQVSPTLAIFNVRTMDQILDESLWQLNLYRWLVGMFAGVALVLSATGLYAMIAYTTVSRMREFAIRLALGSGPRAIVQLVFGGGLSLVVAGLAIGLAAVMALSRPLGRLADLPQVDVANCAIVAVVFLLVTAIACVAPSWRAVSVSPTTTLRHE